MHLWLLSMAGLVLLPVRIDFPGYQHSFVYIRQRLSLFIAIAFCAMVSGGRYGRGLTRLSAVVAVAFFTFVYFDGKALNQVEAKVTALTAGLSPGQRVVAGLEDSGSERLNGLIHMGAAACLGRCFDYANYEPATAQFRIRAKGPNPAAAPTMQIVQELEQAKHIVTAGEAHYIRCARPLIRFSNFSSRS